MSLGLIGLGRMGGNMVIKLLKGGHNVVVWNRSSSGVEEFQLKVKNEKLEVTDQKLKVAKSVEELVTSLRAKRSNPNEIATSSASRRTPRNDVVVVWLMVPAGETTDQVLFEVAKFVEKNDIVVDGSNANWKDTQRRFDAFTKKGIRYLGMGVAGGVHGPKLGYALMAGGDKSAYDYIVPIMDTLVKPTAGHDYFGTGAAGHFVKMIHNGTEYGYMQALGEGFDLLEHSPYNVDLLKAAKLWAKSSLISGFMMDRAVEALEKDPHMEQIEGVIDATGEAQWTVDTAKELGIPVEIIERSLEYRKRSKTDTKIQASFTAKMVAALRHAFGAHAVKKK